MCHSRVFVHSLMLKVRAKDTCMKYGVFLRILNMVINYQMPSEISVSYVQTLKSYINQLIIFAQGAADREKAANKSSPSVISSVENLKTSTSTQPVQQPSRSGSSSTVAPPSSTVAPPSSTVAPPSSHQRTSLTETQFQILKYQMVAYNNLVQNYRRLTSSIQPLANTTLTSTAKKANTTTRKRPPPPAYRPQIKSPPNISVPSILTVSQINQRLQHNTAHNIPIESNDTSRKAVIAATAKPIPPLLTMRASDKPSMVLPTQNSQNVETTTIPENTAPPQIVGLNLTLPSTLTTSVPSEVLDDVICNNQRNDLHEEFVDFERYFDVSNSNVGTLLQSAHVVSKDKKNLEICMAGVEMEESSERRKLSEVSQDLPPRTASNDSGMDSPTQVDSSIYENRVCQCGRSAVYVCTCKAVMYCSDACQRIDWDVHKDSYEHRTLTVEVVQRI